MILPWTSYAPFGLAALKMPKTTFLLLLTLVNWPLTIEVKLALNPFKCPAKIFNTVFNHSVDDSDAAYRRMTGHTEHWTQDVHVTLHVKGQGHLLIARVLVYYPYRSHFQIIFPDPFVLGSWGTELVHNDQYEVNTDNVWSIGLQWPKLLLSIVSQMPQYESYINIDWYTPC